MDTVFEQMQILRAGRYLASVSQDELAELAGVSRQTILRIEKGDPGVGAEQIDKVRLALVRLGLDFLPSAEGRGPAVAVRRTRGKKQKS
jgi:DNA-binding XRE family transcriptional regulator